MAITSACAAVLAVVPGAGAAPDLRSGFAGGSHPPFPGIARSYPTAVRASALPSVGADVDMIGSADPPETSVFCNPGKQTPQNELSIAVNPEDPANLVAGANDYRLYSESQNRMDAAGGTYRSADGGATWTAGLLPGLVRSNRDHPGPYEAAGDPSVAAGPRNTFWYANIAFDRNRSRSSVAVSRSADGGARWETRFVIRSDDGTFHDKEWIAAHPTDRRTAYVTWTVFGETTIPIVISRTTDGGKTWSSPRAISAAPVNQGSVVQVDVSGRVHVVWVSGLTTLMYGVSTDGGNSFLTRPIAVIAPPPSPLPFASFRTPTLPGFAVDGDNLYAVWQSWNGVNADVVFLRSTDGGLTWLGPVLISPVPGDQFFPWVAARGHRVYASWYDRASLDERVTYRAAASGDGGLTWSAPVPLSTATSDVSRGNRFPFACDLFLGDYTGIAVGSDGVAHAAWSDVRDGNSPGDPGTTADQDPYTAAIALP